MNRKRLCRFVHIQIFNRKYQIPVFAPDNVAVVYHKSTKQILIKVLVVLRMRMLANKLTYVDDALMSVIERQPHTKIASIFCRNNKNVLHNYILSLI